MVLKLGGHAPNYVARADADPRRNCLGRVRCVWFVCVSPARPESDGGARPESIHPSVGENSTAPGLPVGHPAVSIRFSRGAGEGPGSELQGGVRCEQLHQLFESLHFKVI